MSGRSILTIGILAVSFLYIFAYYIAIKGTLWDELPLFVTNKTVALAAVVFIALSYACGHLARYFPKRFEVTLAWRKFFGLLGFGLASAHALMATLILSPDSFGRLFDATGKLNLTGELTLLFGVLAFFLFAVIAISSLPSVMESIKRENWIKIQRLGYWGLALIFLHVFFLGIEGWLQPESWPSGLLPISLIAGAIILVVFLLKACAYIFPKR